MRPIDADALKGSLSSIHIFDWMDLEQFEELIDKAPTIQIPVPDVKRGKMEEE